MRIAIKIVKLVFQLQEPTLFVDTITLPIVRKNVRNISIQGEYESRRWGIRVVLSWWLHSSGTEDLFLQIKPKGVATQMKALDEHILMVLCVLLLEGVYSLANETWRCDHPNERPLLQSQTGTARYLSVSHSVCVCWPFSWPATVPKVFCCCSILCDLFVFFFRLWKDVTAHLKVNDVNRATEAKHKASTIQWLRKSRLPLHSKSKIADTAVKVQHKCILVIYSITQMDVDFSPLKFNTLKRLSVLRYLHWQIWAFWG